MRTPKKPPNWMTYLSGDKHERTFFEALVNPAVKQFVRETNDRYFHWDKLRVRPLPPGLTPEMAWAVVKFGRNSQQQDLPLRFWKEGGKLKFWLPPQQQQWVSYIDKQAGGLIGGRLPQGVPDDDDRYLFNSLMEEAIASSQIEGACTTREVGKEMLRTGRRPRNTSEQMILNNYSAILDIREARNDKLTPALLRHLQEVLTEKTLETADGGGRYRREDEKIRVVDATGEPLFVPPSADSIEDRVREVCDFANTESKPFIHPVVKAMALHFAIGFIHPFVDGNGRTARALFYWYMLKSGYWLFEYLPISRIIAESPVQYARAYLHSETDAGDLTYFNQYHLGVVIKAIKALHEYLAAQQEQLAEAEQLLVKYPELNHRQKAVISHLLKRPADSFTIQEYEGKFHVTYNTARTDLTELTKLGLFEKRKKVGRGKGWLFTAASDLVKRLKTPGQRPPGPRRAGETQARGKSARGAGSRPAAVQRSLFDMDDEGE